MNRTTPPRINHGSEASPRRARHALFLWRLAASTGHRGSSFRTSCLDSATAIQPAANAPRRPPHVPRSRPGMSYESIDAIQKALADDVFKHAKDRKKAAGRALGTIVELITYYTLRQWGLGSY